jgi:PhzF family phenazine biosynthesis protein
VKLPYKVVDVFTAKPLLGNPVAVIMDASRLETKVMQAIANWTNLSETTFVLPPSMPGADYHLRIFTPRMEFLFAGHPTLGSAYALLESGQITSRNGKLVQQCGVGLVELTVSTLEERQSLSFKLPRAKHSEFSSSDIAELETILGCPVSSLSIPGIVDVGPIWLIAQLSSVTTVLSLKPNMERLAKLERRLGAAGLTVFARYPNNPDAIEVRTFAPSNGIEEDPVCGSGNGSVAAFQWHRGLLPPTGTNYIATQGQIVGRNGKIQVRVEANGSVHIGGSCVTCVEGTLAI